MEHAFLSIIILQDEFLQATLKFYKQNIGTNNSNYENILADERLSVLAISYHNLAAEYEHLKRYDESILIYQKASNFASENLSENN